MGSFPRAEKHQKHPGTPFRLETETTHMYDTENNRVRALGEKPGIKRSDKGECFWVELAGMCTHQMLLEIQAGY